MPKTYSLYDVIPIRRFCESEVALTAYEDAQKAGKEEVVTFRTLVPPNNKRIIDESIQDVLFYSEITLIQNDDSTLVTTGIVVPKKELQLIGDRMVYPRSSAVARTALALANYQCEIDSNHPTFISKRYERPYTEPHHLIPISFADNFEVSLDVPENVVSLCSHCHNEVHYGKHNISILRLLYENRWKKLEQVGIQITFEELLWMYNVES